MPIVTIQASNLSSEQKTRIGDQVIRALHLEGVAPVSVVVLFKPEETDIFLDGGLVSEAPREMAMAPATQAFRAPEPAPRVRTRKQDQQALKAQLIQHLQTRGALSSFQAQDLLGLGSEDGAPALLRRFFSELEEEGAISKQGQRRGTRYVWRGLALQPSEAEPVLHAAEADLEPDDRED